MESEATRQLRVFRRWAKLLGALGVILLISGLSAGSVPGVVLGSAFVVGAAALWDYTRRRS